MGEWSYMTSTPPACPICHLPLDGHAHVDEPRQPDTISPDISNSSISNDMNARDAAAEAYALGKFPVQNIETAKEFTQDVNFARRMSHNSAFSAGYDAATAQMGVELKAVKRVAFQAQEMAKEIAEQLADSQAEVLKWAQTVSECNSKLAAASARADAYETALEYYRDIHHMVGNYNTVASEVLSQHTGWEGRSE